MKKRYSLIIVLSLALNCYAHSFNFNNENLDIVSIEEVVKSDFLKELQKLPKDQVEDFLFKNWNQNTIVKFKKGTRLPVKVFLKGEFFNLITDSYHYPILLIEKDLYIRLKDRKFLFSADLKNWKEANSFFTGSADIRVGSEKNLPKITIGAELYRR